MLHYLISVAELSCERMSVRTFVMEFCSIGCLRAIWYADLVAGVDEIALRSYFEFLLSRRSVFHEFLFEVIQRPTSDRPAL